MPSELIFYDFLLEFIKLVIIVIIIIIIITIIDLLHFIIAKK